MSHHYAVIGMVMLLAAAPVLAGGNVPSPRLKRAPNLEAFGVVLGKSPTLPACPAATDGHFDSVAWGRHGSKSCLEVGQWKSGRAYVHRLHLGADAASGWFPASCTYRLIVLDGRIADVSVTTDETVTADTVVSILARHYGEKHAERKTNSVWWVAGKMTKKSSIHAEWRFNDLDVRYNGQSDAATTGQVDMLTPAFDAWYQKHAGTKPKAQAQAAD